VHAGEICGAAPSAEDILRFRGRRRMSAHNLLPAFGDAIVESKKFVLPAVDGVITWEER
jgi:hypothetical protein